jgi:SAM-dependent methyltransferase
MKPSIVTIDFDRSSYEMNLAKEPGIAEQFKRPSGTTGKLAGLVMSWQNRTLNRVAVANLQVETNDRVLEIGFGPGDAINLLAKRTKVKSIVGVDPSDVMLDKAIAKNRVHIEVGRVQLIQADVLNLPFESGQFSHAFAVSTFHDWKDRARGLSEVRRVLHQHGQLVLCLRAASRIPFPWSLPGLTEAEFTADRCLIANCGFTDVQIYQESSRKRIRCFLAKVG